MQSFSVDEKKFVSSPFFCPESGRTARRPHLALAAVMTIDVS